MCWCAELDGLVMITGLPPVSAVNCIDIRGGMRKLTAASVGFSICISGLEQLCPIIFFTVVLLRDARTGVTGRSPVPSANLTVVNADPLSDALLAHQSPATI